MAPFEGGCGVHELLIAQALIEYGLPNSMAGGSGTGVTLATALRLPSFRETLPSRGSSPILRALQSGGERVTMCAPFVGHLRRDLAERPPSTPVGVDPYPRGPVGEFRDGPWLAMTRENASIDTALAATGHRSCDDGIASHAMKACDRAVTRRPS
jgi:hypothetical protein